MTLQPGLFREDGIQDINKTPGLFDIRGDEKSRGPLFNFARIFTYSHTIRHFRDALRATMENINDHKAITGAAAVDGDLKRQLRGNAWQTAQYAGLHDREIYAYPEWHEVDPFVWRGMAFSAFLALFLQWGTTGAAVMIAYLTPILGLGCRSGAYLIYGIAATTSWFLMVVSSLFSHAAMLRYQRDKQKSHRKIVTQAVTVDKAPITQEDDTKNPENGAIEVHDLSEKASMSPSPNSNHNPDRSSSTTHQHHPQQRYWDIIPVRPLATLTRYAGKTIAVINAFFLVGISLAEFIGGYENCWCKADAPGLGARGWVMLFKTGKDLEQAARLPWAMGVMLSIFVCVSSFGVFWGGM